MFFSYPRPCIVFTCLLVSLLWNLSLAQEPHAGLKSVIPKSPNAAALGKFGDVPVNIYNGTASISIPLYTLREGDIELPISLDYHTGGIRLNERAGWVGLGWALNAGGIITRNIKGHDDFYYFDSLRDELITRSQIDSVYDVFGSSVNSMRPWLIFSTSGEMFDYRAAPLGTGDFEYDIFTYNFLGKSGKFIITRKGEVIMEKINDLKVEYFIENNYHRFKFTDEFGRVYYFKDAEFSSVQDRPVSQVSSWYLSRIESPIGNRIDFSYRETIATTLPQEIASSSLGCSAEHDEIVNIAIGTCHAVLVLDTIKTEDIIITFPADNLREDYPGDRIIGLKVSDVNNVTKKQFTFSYSYFNSDVPAETNKEFKRLRLDKVTETANGLSLSPYTFLYNEPSAWKQNLFLTSKSFDHWGFFNGPDQSTLLPAFSGYIRWGVTDGNLVYRSFPGADKSPSPQYMKVFSLNEIIYPTGGKTVLELEPNTYFPRSTRSRANEFEEPLEILHKNSLTLVTTTGMTNHQIDLGRKSSIKVQIGFHCDGNNNCGYYRNSYDENIYCEINGMKTFINSNTLSCQNNVCSTEFMIDTTEFTNPLSWKTMITDTVTKISMITVNFLWDEQKTGISATEKFLYGGGLRIKRIRTLDSNDELIQSKEYGYHYSDVVNGDTCQFSHGKIMSLPSYYRYNIEQGSIAYSVCINFARYGTSVLPVNPSVGYSSVTEYIFDRNQLKRLGKTVYHFENKEDSTSRYVLNAVYSPDVDMLQNQQPPGIINLNYCTNGLQRAKKEYLLDNSGVERLIKLTENSYDSTVLNNYFSLNLELRNVGWRGGPGPTYEYFYYVYPSLRQQRILPSKTKTTLYDPEDRTKFVTTEETFTYNSHQTLPTARITTTSTGTQEEYSVYPKDYLLSNRTPAWITNLVNRNIVATPIEVYTAVSNDQGKYATSGVLTMYDDVRPLPDTTYYLEIETPLPFNKYYPSNITGYPVKPKVYYKPKLIYHTYDDKGNILSMSKQGDIRSSFVWGYNKQYPIAEVKNASETQVAHYNFEELTSGFSSVAKTGNKSHTGVFSVGLPSPGTYKLSYWKKESYAAWVLVENTISGTTSIGAAGTLIDDVRIHPVTAQMTTYTYDTEGRMTSATSANHITAYYEYDDFGRLSLMRDDNRNIVKQYTYHYQAR
jgi:YD repeat-containing protein